MALEFFGQSAHFFKEEIDGVHEELEVMLSLNNSIFLSLAIFVGKDEKPLKIQLRLLEL